jgi:alkylhydroperoxidase/carboxymuconolactone decarboxylase family protein YurZ
VNPVTYYPAPVQAYHAALADTGVLAVRTRHLTIFAIHLCQGRLHLAADAARQAAAQGVTPAQWEEILGALVISRGTWIYAEGSQILAQVLPGWTTDSHTLPSAALPEPTSKDAAWLQKLAEINPEASNAYRLLYASSLPDGAATHREKELVLTGVNAAEGYRVGIRVHAERALASGASLTEVWEAASMAILANGVPGWVEAAATLESLQTDQKQKG